MTYQQQKIDVRFIQANNCTYFRKEDIINFILEMAAGEETDVRNRLMRGCENLNSVDQNSF